MAQSLHDMRFPNESNEYREARNELLLAERELKRQIERVAAQRRTLPLGGALKEDYVFDEQANGSAAQVKFSELFGKHNSLVVYNFMFNPRDPRPCPSCTSILDGLDGQARHITQSAALAVVARSPIDRVMAFAHERGWRHLRLLSSANNSFNADYFGEKADGSQRPVLHAFARRDGKIFHTWSSELFRVAGDPGQDPRHVDLLWPLWHVLDITPEGRGTDWRPTLEY